MQIINLIKRIPIPFFKLERKKEREGGNTELIYIKLKVYIDEEYKCNY